MEVKTLRRINKMAWIAVKKADAAVKAANIASQRAWDLAEAIAINNYIK
jgi:hypothetical protein